MSKATSILNKALAFSSKVVSFSERQGIPRNNLASYTALLALATAGLGYGLSSSDLNRTQQNASPFAPNLQVNYQDTGNTKLIKEQFIHDGKASVYFHPFDDQQSILLLTQAHLKSALDVNDDSATDIKVAIRSYDPAKSESQSICNAVDWGSSAVILNGVCAAIISTKQVDRIHEDIFKSTMIEYQDVRSFVIDHELIHSHSLYRSTNQALFHGSKENNSDIVKYAEAVADVGALLSFYKENGTAKGDVLADGLIKLRGNDGGNHSSQALLAITKAMINDDPKRYSTVPNKDIVKEAIYITLSYAQIENKGTLLPEFNDKYTLPSKISTLVDLMGKRNSTLISQTLKSLGSTKGKYALMNKDERHALVFSQQDKIQIFITATRYKDKFESLINNPTILANEVIDISPITQGIQTLKGADLEDGVNFNDWVNKNKTSQKKNTYKSLSAIPFHYPT